MSRTIHRLLISGILLDFRHSHRVLGGMILFTLTDRMDDTMLCRAHKVYALDITSFRLFIFSSFLFNHPFSFIALLLWSITCLLYLRFGFVVLLLPNISFFLFFSYYLPIRSTSSPLHLTPPQAGNRIQNAEQSNGGRAKKT